MLITTRLAFLQQIQKAAISGYFHYITGSIEIEKLPNLVKKFEKLYQINQTRQQAYTKRLKGLSSAKFYCYADEAPNKETNVFWTLLFTQGKTEAQHNEQLKDLRLKKQRFEYSDYQLIQKPRADGKQKFTFQLKADSFNYYQDKIRKTVRHKNLSELNKLIRHINLMPGFAGLRSQRKKLQSVLKGELKKHLNPKDQTKVHSMTNFYHRQQKIEHIKRLNIFIKQMVENNRTIKQQLAQYRNNAKKRSSKIEKSQRQKDTNTQPSTTEIETNQMNPVINEQSEVVVQSGGIRSNMSDEARKFWQEAKIF